jgi:hypothetical protein
MPRPIISFPILLLVSMNFAPLLAQNQPKSISPSRTAATQQHNVKPADVASPDAILAIARRSERWGSIMEAFSTYESRHDPKDAVPFARGINSFQLFFDGTRWWIMTIYLGGRNASKSIAAGVSRAFALIRDFFRCLLHQVS